MRQSTWMRRTSYAPILDVTANIKQKLRTRHYKTHRPSGDEHKCPVCNKAFHKAKYLREDKQAYTDELPFEY